MSEAPITPLLNSPKNWPEDFPHENGNYHCHCCICGSYFIGHKRRVVCKECVAVSKENAKLTASAPSLLSELEQLRGENEVLKQQAAFSEEIKKQMQVRISDEMARTFNRDHNITQLENLCRSKDMQIEKLHGENTKYRQALEEISDNLGNNDNYSDDSFQLTEWINSVAKKTLNKTI